MGEKIRDLEVTFFNYIEYYKDEYTIEFYDSRSDYTFNFNKKKLFRY